MACVCFYFQVHQPYRLRRYSVFDVDANYFDDYRNGELCKRIAHRCYLPANETVLSLIQTTGGQFRVAYSLTGVIIEQFKRYAPEVLASFERLAETGCVEFLTETYYHTMAFLYSRDEFWEQVELQRQCIENTFGQQPHIFRNTELIYNNDLAYFLQERGFRGIIVEGADHILGDRSPSYVYRPPHGSGISLLLKNYRLSDDIAFRFSNRQWAQWPLTPEKFADWIEQADHDAHSVNLFMDYETFGEHQWPETGIFDFLHRLPQELLRRGGHSFRTPSQVIDEHQPIDEYDAPNMISWADTERDLSAWLGNAMQSNALHELYRLERDIKQAGDPEIIADWRKLQASDHFYYMCTKWFADGDVHKYFNPYESPYDSYINFMNVLDNLRARLRSL